MNIVIILGILFYLILGIPKLKRNTKCRGCYLCDRKK